jgi:hypothetical protein
MAQQVLHLSQVAERHNVTIHVIPSEVVAHPGLTGPFVIMEFEDAPTITYAEARASGVFQDDSAAVEIHKQTADRLLALSLDTTESIRLMSSIAKELSQP